MVIPPPAPDTCTQVGPDCPVEGTILGYYPDIGANAAYAGFFALFAIINLGLGVRYKTWTYMVAMSLGCVGEAVGYAGRIIMWNNPFDTTGFQMQICCLIISPAFISAAIYLTLKYLVISFGESWSRLRPARYTHIFIAGDLLSLVLQGAGGGIAATADFGSEAQDNGTNIMIAGVVWQVFTLTIFGFLLVEYAIRTYKHREELSDEARTLLQQKSFRCFLFAIALAFVTIFARCVYRIPELAFGWRSELMREEVDFIVLEGAMIVTAVLALTVFHPGYCFPALAKAGDNSKSVRGKSIYDDSDVEMMSARGPSQQGQGQAKDF
ncbi:RTA1 like protein-domain-containing protein [Bipolaris maydis]|nr:RTA1 like protein-domain-containing protein [Bipolaris maydis]